VQRGLPGLCVAALALVLSACTAGPSPAATTPVLTPTAPASDPAASPAMTGPVLVTDTSDFAQHSAAAIAAAQVVPLAGMPPSTSVQPACQRIGDSGSEPPTRMCMAAFPASQPMVTITVTSAGSAGTSGWMMVAAEMPDGIEGTALPKLKLGDEARLVRTWGAQGCSAVLAVRKGTLVVSVRVLLTPGSSTADCGTPAPTEYLETIARGLIEALAPFASVGLPVDDLAGRNRAVQLIVSGKLIPSDRDLVTLPADLAHLSDSAEVVAMRDGADWTIVFFEIRGVVDHYSGWVFTSTGKLGPDEDPLGGGSAVVKRIDAHWFHVVTN
jgi:hypothetical protein